VRGDMFIFDNVVHMYDNTPDNVLDPVAKNNLEKFHVRYTDEGEDMSQFSGAAMNRDDALRQLFTESETDMAMAQTVPLFGWWKEGFAPARLQHELQMAAPDRVVFCGGVDPLFQGVRDAVKEMERQVVEWGAVSMKFYKSHGARLTWRADDREIAYPMWEKAMELGLSSVQFHCGGPLGREPVEALRAIDIQAAAADFPDLNFIIHHLGDPYIDETLNIASRFDNIYLALSSTVINIWPIAPWETYERMGKCLARVGEDKLLWGSEAFIWPHLQMLIDIFGELRIPEELQDRYGYPELTDQARRKILGLNQAKILGLDVATKLKQLYPDLDEATIQRAAGAEL
jgi:predicted TIM-barrel fold metal-dependent hydrolase